MIYDLEMGYTLMITAKPEFMLAAVQRIYDDIPTIIAINEWETIAPKVDEYIATIENAKSPEYRLLPSTQLYDTLTYYESLQKRLDNELIIQDVLTENIWSELKAVFDEDTLDRDMMEAVLATTYASVYWDVDPATIPSSDNIYNTKITTRGNITDGGKDGANSIRFRKIEWNWSKFLLHLTPAIYSTVDAMISKPNFGMLTIGFLALVGLLHNQFIKEISQQEATVLWGFIWVASHKLDKQATTAQIRDKTNEERQKRGLDKLNKNQIKLSLESLEKLGTILQIDDSTWKLRESFEFKD